jgi:hypothetical protein
MSSTLPRPIPGCAAPFVTLGFIVHLLLDEFYSVDLFGKKLLKSSFGTALQLRQPQPAHRHGGCSIWRSPGYSCSAPRLDLSSN